MKDTFVYELSQRLPGKVKTQQAAAAAIATALWNGAGEKPLHALVTCHSVDDIVTALKCTEPYNTSVSVLGGGHDWAKRAIVADGLVLDMRRMAGVSLDSTIQHVSVAGGALTRDVLASLPPGTVTVTGTNTTVGFTGLTLGGGYGRLISKFGLAIDALTQADLVLSDGTFVRANCNENTDLFWAVRGGGGNFGVVTGLEMKVFDLPTVISATVLFPLSQAACALEAAQEILDEAPDELTLYSGFIKMPTGEGVLYLQPLAIGDSKAAASLLDRVCGLNGAQVAARQQVPFRETFDPEIEKTWPHGSGYQLTARNVKRLSTEVIDRLVEAASSLPSASSAIIIHDFHGFASRVASDATAFPLREDHFDLQLVASWAPESEEAESKAQEWFDRVCHSLEEITMPSGYVNLLGPDEEQRVVASYGPALSRLQTVKRACDPIDRFCSNVGHLTEAVPS